MKTNLEKHAEQEMKLANLYDKNADYDGMIPRAVMKLIKAHASEGHSGGSHWLTLEIFNKLVNFQTLTPITNNPNEWTCVGEYNCKNDKPLYQNKRDPSYFSNDGGITWWNVNDK